MSRPTGESDHQVAYLGDLPLQHGGVLKDAVVAFETFGSLNAARDNAIVYPTSFGTTHRDTRWLVGSGRALDPDRYFIVIPNLFGNGLSSSPSRSAPGSEPFPAVTMADNVAAHHRVVTEHLGAARIALAVGFSMGAQAAYHWGALHPEIVDRIAPICGSARTSRHNFVFLEGVKAALTGDPNFCDGRFTGPPQQGLRALARVYAGWGLSQAFYREEIDLKLGFNSLQDFIERDWEPRFAEKDGNDLLAMIWTWQHADISAGRRYSGDLSAALRAIVSQALVMPSETDLYFRVEDSRGEVAHMPDATLLPIRTVWGHRVNNPSQNPADADFVDRALRAFLSGAGRPP